MADNTSTTAPWYQGKVDAELVGHWQNKGWDKLTPEEVAVNASKAWKEAERFVGTPADKLLKMPDPTDTAAVSAFWQRLGAPKDAKEYDFSSVKHADGKELDAAFVDSVRATAARLNLPKDTAIQFVQDLVKQRDGAAVSTNAERDAQLATERDALKKNWGTNFEANLFVAKAAAAKLGFDPAVVSVLEGIQGVGYSKVMEMFRSLGERMGEDKLVRGGGPSGGVMTREQAVARKSEIMGDKAWTDRYFAGDTTASREMLALNEIITGQTFSAQAAR